MAPPKGKPGGGGEPGTAEAPATNRAAQLRARVLAERPNARVVGRDRSALRFYDPDTDRNVLVATVGPLHVREPDGTWAEIDTAWADNADPDWANAARGGRGRFYASNGLRRRIVPRAEYPDEHLTLEAVEVQGNNNRWTAYTFLPGQRGRNANQLSWENNAVRVEFAVGPERIKDSIVLKQAVAAQAMRWRYAASGLAWDGTRLVSLGDGETVGELPPAWLEDAAGIHRDIPTTIDSQYITFRPDLSGLTYPVLIDPTIDTSVGASGDDGYWTTSSFANTSILRFGRVSLTGYNAFTRFTGLGALDGATISAAYITFTAELAASGTTCNVRFYGQAADNAAQPSSVATCTGPARTTASVDWNNVPAFASATAYDSPSLVSVVQEMADNGYLASGVGMFYAENNASSSNANRRIYSYDDVGGTPPALHVEYVGIVAKAGSDSDTVTASETAVVTELARTHNRTDSGTVGASEWVEVSATLAATTDAGTVTAVEQAVVSQVASKTASDSGTVTATETSQLNVVKPSSDSDTVSADELPVVMSATVAAMDSQTVTAGESLALSSAATASDDGLVDAGESVEIVAAAATSDDEGFVEADDVGLVTASATASDSGTVTAGESSVRTIIPIVTEPRIALDVYRLGGPRVGSGPIAAVLAARYSGRADEIGSWSATVPATVENADELVRGREIRLRREGEGVVFRGVIDRAEVTVGDRDERLLEIGGQSIAAELLWANTLLGRMFSGATVASAATTLLSGTGWSLGTVDSGPLVSSRFDGASIWAALREITETFGWHLIEDNLTRSVDLLEVGAPSGLVLRQVEVPDPDLAVVPLVALAIRDGQTELWNRIIPLGAGEGINVLTLQYSTRATPYTIHAATGPDGQPYWYLEDTASIAEHGARVKVLKVDDIAPLSNSAAEIEAAANTLYDVASAWLGYHAHPAEFYEADIAGLHHIDPNTSQRTFRVGQTARLQWRGVVEDEAGTRLWRSVDADVYLMGFEREFRDDGSDAWRLELATVDQHAEGAGDRIVQAIEDLWAIKTAMKPYTYREIHGPFVESVASGSTATIPVDFDDNVTYLHQAMLSIRKRRVKSNVSAAAAGGGQTSSSGGATTTSAGGGQTSSSGGGGTTSSGGGQTSSAGTSHTHSVSGQTAQSGGSHIHVLGGVPGLPVGWTTPAYRQQIRLYGDNQAIYGYYVGRDSQTPETTNFYTFSSPDPALMGTHTHSVGGTTSGAEGSHTHSVSNHSHSVSSHTHSVSDHTHSVGNHTHTVGDHVHALTYGIYLGPTASAPQFRVTINGVDRTSALGGPWNNNTTLDITAYLTNANGQVLRQTNEITISAAQLCDVELTVKSLVTAMSLVPV